MDKDNSAIIPEFDFEDDNFASVEDITRGNESLKQDVETDSKIKPQLDFSDNDDEDNILQIENEGEEEDTNKEDEDSTPTDADSDALATFKTLVDKGILPYDDEFSGTWEDLDERISNLPQLVAQSIISSAPDITQKIIEYSFLKENITKEDLKSFINTYLEDMDETSIENKDIDSIKNYIQDKYSSKGLSDKAISAIIRDLEDQDFDGQALISEAKKLSEDPSNRKSDKLMEQAKEEQEMMLQQQQQFIENVANEIKATGWAESRINTIASHLRDNKVSTIIQNAFLNPKALVQLANFTTYYDERTNTFNFEEFAKQANTTKVENLKTNLLKDNFKNSGNSKNRSNENESKVLFKPILD
jgi:hypothetical protein